MANLTLSIDDALLQQARQAALRENTSVNALVLDFMERYVDARTRRLQALAAFEAVANGSHFPCHVPPEAGSATAPTKFREPCW